MRLLSFLAVTLICHTLCAQIELAITPSPVLADVVSPRFFNGKLICDESSNPKKIPGAIIKATGPYKGIFVVAETRPDGDLVDLDRDKDSPDEWLLIGSGKFRVAAYAYSPETGLMRAAKDVVLGPTPPPPPPPGPPPTACDQKTNTNFDRLAKRCCEWASEVKPVSQAKRKELAAAYLDVSRKLESGEILTINAASQVTGANWARILTEPERADWAGWSAKVNEDLARWWNAQSTNTDKRALMVAFYAALGQGLE